MPPSNGDGVQVLGHWGPNVDATITDTDGSSVAARNDTWTVDLGATPTTATTFAVAAAGTSYLIPGAIYELTVSGANLGSPCFFNVEWAAKAGSGPAPALGDWAWPFGSVPQWVFVAKEGQEKLSLKLYLNGMAAANAFGTVDNRIQVRRLT